MSEESTKAVADTQSSETSVWRKRDFTLFWFGQTLSVLGDAFATIALPLLVLQVTGSVAQMGLVTGIFVTGFVTMGIFAGIIVDRVDRRRLMICCDVVRTGVYFSLPLCWWWFGPHVWLIYVAVALGSCLGVLFWVAYVTAMASLVEKEQMTEANGQMQASAAIAFLVGPVLAGLVSSTRGPTFAISLDALSFAISALSLVCIRLRPSSYSSSLDLLTTGTTDQAGAAHHIGTFRNIYQEFLAGLRFLWHEPTLRSITIMLAFLTLLAASAQDLFIFHMKHDMRLGDTPVGMVFGLASLGSLSAGLLVATLRKHWGFSVCWLGGWIVNACSLLVIGLSFNLVLVAVLAMCFTFGQTVAGISSLSLRQEITPDHLLGRVTSVFWTIQFAPGSLGAVLFTSLAERLGTQFTLLTIGGLSLLVVAAGFFTPIRQRHPELS
jgi:MFS family permease